MIGRINFTGDRLGPQVSLVAAAIIGSGIAGAGASIYSASQAKKAQEKAVNKSIAQQNKMLGVAQEAEQPFIDTGKSVLPQIQNLTSANSADIQAQLEQLPGYQFARTQGLKSVQSGMAARGLGASGAALKGAAQYAENLADTTFGNHFNRLLSTAQLGSGAAGQLGNQAITTGQGIGSNIISGGNAQGAADIAMGNAAQGGLNSITSGILINKLLGSNGAQSSDAFAGARGSPFAQGAGGYNGEGPFI